MSTPVPFIDLKRYEAGFYETTLSKVSELLKSASFVAGPVISELEKSLATFTQTKHAICCANGTDAIQLALRACDVGPGDKVIIPDLTFWATFEAVVNVGATPVICDVNPQTLHLDFKTLQSSIAKHHPKAVLLVHLYGWVAPETFEMRKFCHTQGIKLIEDSAQAFGALINGESVFKNAYLSTTSFYPAKVLGASGDAGALFTNDDTLQDKLRSLLNHGRLSHYDYQYAGWNSRVGTYEATFLLESLSHIKQRIASRLKVIAHYRNELQNLPFQMPSPSSSVSENGYLNVLMMDPTIREGLIEYLKSRNIGFATTYPSPMSAQKPAQKLALLDCNTQQTQKICKGILNLPCFAYMTEKEMACVTLAVKEYFKNHG